MKVCITGFAGYIGGVLTRLLLNNGYDVVGVDNFIYNQVFLHADLYYHDNFTCVTTDVRDLSSYRSHLESSDIIIPLAALVGAPLCDKNMQDAKSVNYDTIVETMKILSPHQLVIYPNTNSGYGTTGPDICTEDTPSNPISLYGKTKQDSEDVILQHDRSLSLRLATVFGVSPRMRLDLLVNTMVYDAIKRKQISVFDASFRRNFVHVKDVADCFLFWCTRKPNHKIYNLGNDNLNMTKAQLAYLICDQTGAAYIHDQSKSDADKRDYNVSSAKLEAEGFSASIGIVDSLPSLTHYISNLVVSAERYMRNI